MATSSIGWTFDGDFFHQHCCIESIIKSSFVGAMFPSNHHFPIKFDSCTLEKLPIRSLNFVYKNNADSRIVNALRNYWSIKLATKLADNRPFTMIHMAASLDGKIATNTGHSKWIGNEQNLIHAHRLRAIFDGILVGAGTVKKDSPTLNVRRVSGKNPTRFVLSNRSNDFSNLQKVKDVPTFLVRHKKYQNNFPANHFDDVILYEGNHKKEQIQDIQLKIREKGIRSLLIEGGPTTVSHFLCAQEVDIVQFHLTPLILGSGKSMMELPEIATIKEGKFLKNPFYTQMGDGIMVTGALC